MAMSETTYQVLDRAIKQKLKVRIKYQPSFLQVTELIISPFAWSGLSDVRAHCDPNDRERTFRVPQIVECSFLSDEQRTKSSSASIGGLPTGTPAPTPQSTEPPCESPTSVRPPVDDRTPPAAADAAPQRLPEKSRIRDYEDHYVGYYAVPHPLPERSRIPSPEPPQAATFRATPSGTRRRPTAISAAGSLFTQVAEADQWTRLVKYYRECLVVENRQQYVVKKSDLHPLPTTGAEALKFMQRQTVRELPRLQSGRRSQEEIFVARRADNVLMQLCLGYPLLVLEPDKFAPLLYCPVQIEEQTEKYILRAEDFEVSYAALHELGFKEEEIDAFLSATAQAGTSEQHEPLQAFLDRIINQLGELLAWKLEFSQTLSPFTLLASPHLFWVNANTATENLIKELAELSVPARWAQAPIGLKTLLSLCPDHEYPLAPTLEQDRAFYVSTVNASQMRAVAAARVEPETVVTGPPGTGKSELVLSIIADASYANQRILFASHNNAAVNVVMRRLQDELDYPGAVRTGSNPVKKQAAERIRRALDESSTHSAGADSAGAGERYRQARENAVVAQSQLENIRQLAGLLESQQRDREDWRKRLPGPIVKLATDLMPPYVAAEANQLQEALANLRKAVLQVEQDERELATAVRRMILEDPDREPIVQQLKHFESQWGPFGDNFLAGAEASEARHIAEYIQTWLRLVRVLDEKSQVGAASQASEQTERAYGQETGAISQPWNDWIPAVADQHSATDLQTLENESGQLALRFSQLADHHPSHWERLAAWLHLRDPMRKARRSYREWVSRITIPLPEVARDEPLNPPALAERCRQVQAVARAAQTFQQRLVDRGVLENCRVRFESAALDLPEAIRSDLARLGQFPTISATLRTALHDLLERAETLQVHINDVAAQVNDLIDGNRDGLTMLHRFKETMGEKERHLWHLNLPLPTAVINKHLHKWHALVSFWTSESAVRELERKLSTLPDEADALTRLGNSQRAMLQMSRDVLRENWLERSISLSNTEVQHLRDYAEALNILGGPYDPNAYGAALSTAEKCFPIALRLFGVWATTNLSTKSNFPLTPGLFDLLIIDEASQCDIASALPLLYRAKRVVIIGDPNQLRHVATITESADASAATRFGIARDAFGFRGRSLYDLAQRSVGKHPDALWLDEHYRSDARVIGFSNKQFYGSRLKIKTDLTQRGFPRSFLNDCGGITWWHVPGTTQRPSKGSAYNLAEFNALRELLPRILNSVKPYGLRESDIGIVTPFRNQADRIERWCKVNDSGGDAIRVGTAHAFQGDERYVIVLSPVLSSGIRKETLRWLDDTCNLLNVAVTRARLAVIVVGDWEFCHTLPTTSVYRRLADYVATGDGRVVKEAREIPLLGGPPFNIVGQVIDPHNPEYNRTTLRRWLGGCRDYVWWLDNYFNNQVIDLLNDVLDETDCRLREVHLLTDERVTKADGAKPQLDPKGIEVLAAGLAARGIVLEARSLTKKELGVHDRLLFGPGQAINMPPFGAAYGQHKYISEYTASNISPTLFEELWAKAKTVAPTP